MSTAVHPPAPLGAARWARIYWPAALAVCIGALMGAPHRWTGLVLAGGTGVLGIPESAMLLSGRYANTLSWWTWRTLHVVKNQPPSQWTAGHYFAAALEVIIAGDALRWLWHLGYSAEAAGAGFAIWLWPHLFVKWWRA